MGSDFNNWPYRATFHIDHTKVSADYGAFTLPLRWTGSVGALPSAILQTGNAQAAKSDGGDLRFTDQYGNEVPFDIVEFTQAAAVADARAEIWVQLPSLSTTADTKFYMFWGNAAASGYASGDPYGRYNAFAGWNMVYHGNDTGSGNMNNSKASTWNMTNSGTTIIDGKIGKGRSFNGSSSYMYISGGLASGTPDTTQYLTIMGWAYWNAWSSGAPVVDFGNGAAQDNFKVYNYNNLAVSDIFEDFINNTTHHYKGDTPGWKDLSTWKHFIITWDNVTSDLIYCYINGVQQGSPLSANDWLRNAVRQYCNLGKSNDASPIYFNGWMDEIRIGNSYSSATYAAIAYNAQSSPETFIILDTEVTKGIFPGGWKFKCPLTQDHTKCGSGTQSNFTSPFVWTGSQATSNLPQAMFDADGTQPAKSDGSDLRFTSDAAGTTQIPFEIVSFSTDNNPANARAEIWVKVPSVNSSTDTVIYVWWGRSDAIAYLPGEAYGQYAVWTEYKTVYHMDGSGNISDSTGNGWTGTNNGSTSATGKLGNARNFVAASSQYINLGAGYTALDGLGYLTINAWINPTSLPFGAWPGIFVRGNGSAQSRPIVVGRSGENKVRYNCHYSGGSGYSGDVDTPDCSAGAWQMITFTWNGTTGTHTPYRNAAAGSTTSCVGTILNNDGTNRIGSYPTSGIYFNGNIDEIQIASVARSSGWVTSDYNSQNEPQTFWGVGSVLTNYVQIVISGAWKVVSDISVAIGGVWKTATQRYLAKTEAWKNA